MDADTDTEKPTTGNWLARGLDALGQAIATALGLAVTGVVALLGLALVLAILFGVIWLLVKLWLAGPTYVPGYE